MKSFKYLVYFLPVIMVFLISSCSDEQEYEIYPGKVNSITVHPGKNRIKLSVILGSDPSVMKVKAYWKNKSDSLEIDVTQSTGIDTVNMMISNLPEGLYNFELFTYDSKGNRSVVTTASGFSYGSIYEGSLLDRLVISASCRNIKWGAATDGILGEQVKYTDSSNISHQIFAPKDEMLTTLPNLGSELTFEYRTMYIPHLLAIDTFYTEYKNVELEIGFLSSGIYEVISSNASKPWFMPKGGQLINVTQISDNEFSFILAPEAIAAIPIVVKVDPITNITSVSLQQVGIVGSYEMTAETIDNSLNYVSPCDSIISLYLHMDDTDNRDLWGDCHVEIRRKSDLLHEFKNPIFWRGGDPWVLQKDGFYFYTCTSGNRIEIRQTTKMEELENNAPLVIWRTAPGTEHALDIWAPELHFLDGKWYM